MDLIAQIVNLVEGIAVAGAAVVAWMSLTAWRREMRGRRLAEVAEQALALIYEARDVISQARSPTSFGGEGESRPRKENESDNERRAKDVLYAPIERLVRYSEFWARFDAFKYQYLANFGESKSIHFDDIRTIRNRIMFSAHHLIDVESKQYEHEGIKDHIKKWRADIGWTINEDDEISRSVDKIVSEVEKVCRPAIIGRNPKLSW